MEITAGKLAREGRWSVTNLGNSNS